MTNYLSLEERGLLRCRRCNKEHPIKQPPDDFSDEIKPTVLRWGDKKEWWIDLCGECMREMLRRMDHCLNDYRRPAGFKVVDIHYNPQAIHDGPP